MKKLLFLAAAVAMGVMNAQAATLYGEANVYFDADFADYADYSTVFILNTSQYEEWLDKSTLYATLGDYAYGSREVVVTDTSNPDKVRMQYFKTVGDNGLKLKTYDSKVDTVGNFVAVVTDGNSFAKVNAYTITTTTPRSVVFQNEDLPLTEGDFQSFATPTPEPTSGLLLLLGVAGLALKRKRA